MYEPPSRSIGTRPLALSASTESQVYGLFALAIGITAIGAFAGFSFVANPLYTAVSLPLIILEFALIFTSRWWVEKYPVNYALFAVFPFVSGFILIPYLLYVLSAYENGSSLILNALSATVCMALAGAVATRALKWNFSVMGRALIFALFGLLALIILQLFVPALQTSRGEMFISGIGVVIFALFTAYDLQRIQHLGRLGANPFLLALSLYLDIFNLFVYLLRFMSVVSGNRR